MYERGGNYILGEEQHVYTLCASDKHLIYEDPKGKLPVGASGVSETCRLLPAAGPRED